MSNAQRITEWIETCRNAATATFTASQSFEQVVRDMRHAGYALPREVVAGVRQALRVEG